MTTSSKLLSLPEGVVNIVIRGYEKHELCHHLARGNFTQAKLAKMYGVTEQAIYHFKDRHSRKIEELRTAYEKGIATRLTGLWIVEQENRIASYQSDVDMIDQHHEEESLDDKSPALLRIKHNALKNVAEELGALPTRTQVDHSGDVSVKYVVEKPSDAE